MAGGRPDTGASLDSRLDINNADCGKMTGASAARCWCGSHVQYGLRQISRFPGWLGSWIVRWLPTCVSYHHLPSLQRTRKGCAPSPAAYTEIVDQVRRYYPCQQKSRLVVVPGPQSYGFTARRAPELAACCHRGVLPQVMKDFALELGVCSKTKKATHHLSRILRLGQS